MLSFWRDLRARNELRQIIREFKPDLIYSHTFKAGFLVRSMKLSMPIVHAFHGHHLYDPEFNKLKRIIINILERILAMRTQALVTIGDNTRDELLEKRIGKPEKYHSISPGIMPIRQLSRIKLREKFGFEKDELLIVWSGRLTQVKRPDRVIKLAEIMPENQFVIAGTGELLDYLKSIAPNNASILGFQNKDEIWSLADLALCTSESEGMPIALIEAQLAGIPAVAMDVGSVSQVICDKYTGYVVKDFEIEFIERLKELISNPKLRAELGKNAVTWANSEFSPEKMINSHVELFKRVLNQKCI
jgi:glycosyltransferase involved in cell wall biosynthesis